MALKCESLSFQFGKKNVFENINMQIKPGQMTAIVGPNGIGKSTLIKCLSKIYQPEEGIIYLNGNLIAEISGRELAQHLGYVPQTEKHSFNMSVFEMVLLGRKPYIKWKVNARDKEVVEDILNQLNIYHLAGRDVNTLSGGEKQKTAIARALAQEPDFLFLDEPTSSLDINHQIEVMEILNRLKQEHNTAVVVVLHDLNLASRYSDYVYLLGQEGIVAEGGPAQVFTSENVRKLYGIEVRIVKSDTFNYVIPLKGDFSHE